MFSDNQHNDSIDMNFELSAKIEIDKSLADKKASKTVKLNFDGLNGGENRNSNLEYYDWWSKYYASVNEEDTSYFRYNQAETAQPSNVNKELNRTKNETGQTGVDANGEEEEEEEEGDEDSSRNSVIKKRKKSKKMTKIKNKKKQLKKYYSKKKV